MLKRIQKLFSQREILKSMVIRDLKAKYVGSVLGISWAIITPLLIMGVISFVFTKMMRVEAERFPLFVLSAILPWTFFSTSLSEATSSIIGNSSLLRQFTIPKEFLPISSVLANFINFLFGLVVMIPIFVIFKVQIIPFLLLLPVALFLQLIFTVGVALFLSCINVYFQDVNHLLGVGLMFWFWMTPVFYSLEMAPPGFTKWIIILNPMASYIAIYRNLLFEAKMPNFFMIIIAISAALAALVIGCTTFAKYEASFLKRI